MSLSVRSGLVGVVLGAVLAAAGLWLAPDAVTAGEGAPTTTTTAAGEPQPVWHDEHETLIGPGAIVLESLIVEDGVATLRYRVESITPPRNGTVFEDDLGPPVAPEVFVLESGSGEYTASATRVRSTEVRFEVGGDFSVESVTGIRVERVWLRYPYRYDIDLAATRGASIALDEHITVSVDAVVGQAGSTLINLDTTRLSDEFISSESTTVWVTGRGAGWRSNARQSGAGIGGSTGVQLQWHTAEVPDPLPLTVTAAQWLPRDGTMALDIGGLNLER